MIRSLFLGTVFVLIASGIATSESAPSSAQEKTIEITEKTERLDGERIRSLLANQTALGIEGWRQFFHENGSTRYVSAEGSVSSGRWQTKGNLYCSVWPPGFGWSCYRMTGQGNRLRWIAEQDGTISEASMVPGDQTNSQIPEQSP